MIIPTKNRIILEEIKEEAKAGSILLIEKDEKPRKGRVLAVGSDVKASQPDIKIGTVCYFISGIAYRELEVDGQKVLVCGENDIFGYKNDKTRTGNRINKIHSSKDKGGTSPETVGDTQQS